VMCDALVVAHEGEGSWVPLFLYEASTLHPCSPPLKFERGFLFPGVRVSVR
jgi:hypothetical protein